MTYFELETDSREAQYGRLVSAVIGVLQTAVERREEDGETRTSIANRIGCHRSQLSRVLNGSVSNLTLRTISDILWATEHEPEDFKAQAYEDLSPNYVPICRRNLQIWSEVDPRFVITNADVSAGSSAAQVKFELVPH